MKFCCSDAGTHDIKNSMHLMIIITIQNKIKTVLETKKHSYILYEATSQIGFPIIDILGHSLFREMNDNY